MDQEVNSNDQIKYSLLRFYDFLVQQEFQVVFYDNEYGYLGRGFCLGLENETEGVRILFVKEVEIPQIELLIGGLSAPFDYPYKRASRRTKGDGWFRLASLFEFFIGSRLYSAKEYKTFDAIEFQSAISERVKPNLWFIVEAISNKQEMETWLDKYFDFIAARNSEQR